MKAVLDKNNEVISQHVVLADTFLKRLKGLMFSKHIAQYESLLIQPCKSIHTFFMRFPIDVLFLSNTNQIIGLYSDLRPFRISKVFPKATRVLEMQSGIIHTVKISLDDHVRFDA